MPFELCRHIKTDGRRCQAPALKAQYWCFFHRHLHIRGRNMMRAARAKAIPADELKLPPLQDLQSIQVAISHIIQALAADRIDPIKARALLKGIEMAIPHVGTYTLPPASHDPVEHYTPTSAGYNLADRLMSDGSPPPE
jgi:hypothetical protein